MSRLARLVPADLRDDQRLLYDVIATGRRAQGEQLFCIAGHDGALEGPFGTLLLHPELGSRLSELGEGIRYHGTLPASVRELVILLVARDQRSEYEWYAHTAIARSLGMAEEVLDELKHGGLPRELADDEFAAASLYSCVRTASSVPDEVFEVARRLFGDDGVMEIVCLVHYYQLLAALLTTFDIQPPEGVERVFRLNDAAAQ